MLNIVADEAIPLVYELWSPFARVIPLPHEHITAKTLQYADAVLVRSVTSVDADLLKGTSVRWVGTATAGIDHLDTVWLAGQGIAWAYAPGSNARAVAEYSVSTIAWLQLQGELPAKNWTAGLIGAGHIGSLMIRWLQKMGARVLIYDPPRQEREPEFQSTPLSDWVHCDFLSLHVPLTREGPHPTFHLANAALFSQQTQCVLLNTARGEVVSVADLLQAPHITPCIDVWPHEPNIDAALLARARLATPHIAGYSKEAKYNATRSLYNQYHTFHVGHDHPHPSILPIPIRHLDISACTQWQEVVLQVYNPEKDTRDLKQHGAKGFKSLRHHYDFRDSFNLFSLVNGTHLSVYDQSVLEVLGFNFEHLRIS